MRRWLSTTAVLLAGLTFTTVAIQFASIGVLDITAGRAVLGLAIVAAQGLAVTFLLRKSGGDLR
jgi:hypothetical protein